LTFQHHLASGSAGTGTGYSSDRNPPSAGALPAVAAGAKRNFRGFFRKP
jgi:hypothetical protein